MKKIVLFLLIFLWTGSSSSLFAATVQIMDKDELRGMLGSADVVIFDVRTGRDWSSSEYKIQGAVRLEADGIDGAVDKYGKDATLVFYCA